MGDIEILEIQPGSDFHSQCLNLRHQVLRVPIGRSLFTEDLSKEVNDVFLVAVTATKGHQNGSSDSLTVDNKKVVGCIILTIYTGDSSAKTYKIRQMAVAPECQGQGIGKMLVQRAETVAKERGKNHLYLHGRKVAVGFYQKLGYKIVSEEFHELDIPHFALEKALE